MCQSKPFDGVLAAAVLLYSVWVHVPAQQQQQQQQQEDVSNASPPSDSLNWLKIEQCRSMYRSRREMTPGEATAVAAQVGSPNQQYCPALLWTYTGTGNTMTRMLIEVASGWYTGSVYTGAKWGPVNKGSSSSSSNSSSSRKHVLVINQHWWHPFSSLRADGIRPATPHQPPDAKDECRCSTFNRAVAVIRDPYATFLAEYKRLQAHDYSSCSLVGVAGKACTGGHVAVISKADFNASDFRAEVLRMAHEWAAMFDSYDAFQAAHPGGFHLARFEQLTAAGKLDRMQALAGILHALGVPSLGTTAAGTVTAGNEHQDDLEEAVDGKHTTEELHNLLKRYEPARLACAVDAAKHPAIFRPKGEAGINAQFVYGGIESAGLVCDVWRAVGRRAAQHGYAPYGGSVCPS